MQLTFFPDILINAENDLCQLKCDHLWLIGRVLALCGVGRGFESRAG